MEQPYQNSKSAQDRLTSLGLFSDKVVMVNSSPALPKITCSPHLWPLLIHLGMKVLAFWVTVGARHWQATPWFLAFLLVAAEYAYLRIKSSRSMIGVSWWTVVSPRGEILDFFEPSSDSSEHLAIAPKTTFVLVQFVGVIYWLVLGIIYISCGHVSWCLLSIFGLSMSCYQISYYLFMLNSAKAAVDARSTKLHDHHHGEESINIVTPPEEQDETQRSMLSAA